MREPVSSTQLPQCSICKLDPVPQSTQHILFFIFEIALIFINWKFSIIVLMLGYSFPKTVWKCPFCTREIQNIPKQNNLQSNIILRMGNCMALFSINKFRILAFIITTFMVYLFFLQPKYKAKAPIQKTWESLVQNCGYQIYIENSVKANHFYSMYLDSGFDWKLEGIYIGRQQTGISNFQNIFIKMNPSQFKDPNAYDFRIFTKIATNINIQKGDIIYMKGQWEGRQYHNLIFNAIQIKKTGRTKNPQQVQYYYRTRSMLRSHFDSIREQYEKVEQKEKVEKEKQASNQKVIQKGVQQEVKKSSITNAQKEKAEKINSGNIQQEASQKIVSKQ